LPCRGARDVHGDGGCLLWDLVVRVVIVGAHIFTFVKQLVLVQMPGGVSRSPSARRCPCIAVRRRAGRAWEWWLPAGGFGGWGVGCGE